MAILDLFALISTCYKQSFPDQPLFYSLSLRVVMACYRVNLNLIMETPSRIVKETRMSKAEVMSCVKAEPCM